MYSNWFGFSWRTIWALTAPRVKCDRTYLCSTWILYLVYMFVTNLCPGQKGLSGFESTLQFWHIIGVKIKASCLQWVISCRSKLALDIRCAGKLCVTLLIIYIRIGIAVVCIKVKDKSHCRGDQRHAWRVTGELQQGTYTVIGWKWFNKICFDKNIRWKKIILYTLFFLIGLK